MLLNVAVAARQLLHATTSRREKDWMTEDLPSDEWYVAAADRVIDAATNAQQALQAVIDALGEAKLKRVAGAGLVEILDGIRERGGRSLRLAPGIALQEFERAITDFRAMGIRALVDDQHLPFSTIAEMSGVSRQMVARLYRGNTDATD